FKKRLNLCQHLFGDAHALARRLVSISVRLSVCLCFACLCFGLFGLSRCGSLRSSIRIGVIRSILRIKGLRQRLDLRVGVARRLKLLDLFFCHPKVLIVPTLSQAERVSVQNGNVWTRATSVDER